MDLSSVIPTFGSSAVTVVAFVIALSVIVAVHEYGHYIVGRWSGIKAEVFSLGFGPVLWARDDRRGTKWQIAAIPFGGYVKFLGDANAASAGSDDAVVAELSPQERRHTMAGAPLWARAATVAAGPVFNFIFSVLVFAGLILFQGQARTPLTIGEMMPMPYEANELRPGDVMLSAGGVAVPEPGDEAGFEAFRAGIAHAPVLSYRVSRDGQEMDVPGPYFFPPLVKMVAPLSAAADAGFQVGDVIIDAAGQPIFDFDQLKVVVEASEGAPVALTVWRGGEARDLVLTPRRVDEPQAEGGFKTEWRIGIGGGMFFTPATESFGPLEALWLGVTSVWRVIDLAFSGLYSMVTGAISSCNMAGPIAMASLAGHMASQGTVDFVQFLAVMSTAIGLFNLFPVPVLDGGHLVFYAYEAITGRPAPERVHAILMTIGLILILSLMVFAFGNDIICWAVRKGLF